jgi:hypothetical protein
MRFIGSSGTVAVGVLMILSIAHPARAASVRAPQSLPPSAINIQHDVRVRMNPNIQKRIAGKQAILHLLGRLKGAASATPPKAAGRGPNT